MAEMREKQRLIGWIESEIARRTGSSPRGCRKSRRRLLIRLSRAVGFKPHRLTLRCLFTLREKEKALLRVKTVKHRRQAALSARQKVNRDAEGGKLPHTKERERLELTTTQARDLSSYWKDIWEQQGNYNLNHPEFVEWRSQMRDQSEPEEEDDVDELLEKSDVAWKLARRKVRNWKAPGPDGIQGFWLKAFGGMGMHLELWFNQVMRQTKEVPQWMVRGRTVMVPKENCEGKPDQFRPITCLNTSYKFLTGILMMWLTWHVEKFRLLPDEQKASRRFRRGCLDALLIDTAVTGRRNCMGATCQWHGSIIGRPLTWCRIAS